MRAVLALSLFFFSLFAFADEVPKNPNVASVTETRVVDLIDSVNEVTRVPGKEVARSSIIIGVAIGVGAGIVVCVFLTHLLGPLALVAGVLVGGGLGAAIAMREETVERNTTTAYVQDVATKEEFKMKIEGPKPTTFEKTRYTMRVYSDGSYSLRRQ